LRPPHGFFASTAEVFFGFQHCLQDDFVGNGCITAGWLSLKFARSTGSIDRPEFHQQLQETF
jgi:hypothetical protein